MARPPLSHSLLWQPWGLGMMALGFQGWKEPLWNAHPHLAVGEGTGAGQSLSPSPSLTLSVELVRALLNEPASVKVDEVRRGPKGVQGRA